MSLSFLFSFELDSILLLARDHSLPLLQGENLIFKNQFFFMVVKMTQQVHMSIIFVTSDGGRHMVLRNLTNIDWKSYSTDVLTTMRSGTLSQTFTEKENKRRYSYEILVPRIYGNPHMIVYLYLCRLSPKSNAFCMMDERNTFIFGEKEHDHTSQIQLKSCSDCWELILGFS